MSQIKEEVKNEIKEEAKVEQPQENQKIQSIEKFLIELGFGKAKNCNGIWSCIRQDIDIIISAKEISFDVEGVTSKCDITEIDIEKIYPIIFSKCIDLAFYSGYTKCNDEYIKTNEKNQVKLGKMKHHLNIN